MSEQNDGTVASQNEESTEIQKALQKIPADVLIEVLAEKIKRSPDEDVEEVVRTVVSQSFSGPIPPPETLAGYAAAGPDIPDRIVKMAESQQKHRQELEAKSVEASINVDKRGQNYALTVSISIIAGALYLIGIGKEIYGAILFGGTLIGLASVFINGRKKGK